MFETKVGSDACLVLTGAMNESYLITLDQKFSLADLRKAVETKTVSLVLKSPDGEAVAIAYVAIVGNAGFQATGYLSDFIAADFTQDENGVWSAQLS